MALFLAGLAAAAGCLGFFLKSVGGFKNGIYGVFSFFLPKTLFGIAIYGIVLITTLYYVANQRARDKYFKKSTIFLLLMTVAISATIEKSYMIIRGSPTLTTEKAKKTLIQSVRAYLFPETNK